MIVVILFLWSADCSRLEHFVEHTTHRTCGTLHIQNGGKRGSRVIESHGLVIAAGSNARTHKNKGNVIVVVVGCPVRSFIGSANPVRLQQNRKVSRAVCVETAQYAHIELVYRRVRSQ